MTPEVVLAIVMALGFALTNGFHDAANAIATLVATRVARPGPAVALAAVFNLLGPFVIGAAVASTVGTMVSLPPEEAVAVIGAGLTGAVVWNVFTWRRGLPSSSSHALVGGLVGAALLAEGIDAVNWGGVVDGHLSGVFGVLIGLALATILGLVIALAIELIALRAMRRATVRWVAPVSGTQWITSAWLAFSHGSNDASKTVGIIAAILVASGQIASLSEVPVPVVFASSLVLTIGTALGGWSIIKTIGRRIFPIRPLDGLVSQASSAGVILAASIAGAPVSTTQVVSSSIVAIGLGRGRWRHVRWEIVRDIAIAWLTTMPAAGLLGVLFLPLWRVIP